MSPVLKLSWPTTREYWEIPILWEDEHLLALDKPAGLLTGPDPSAPQRPSLTHLLRTALAAGKPWVREHRLTYLSPAYRLDADTSGVLLLAKSKPVLAALASRLGSEQPLLNYVALVWGAPRQASFAADAPLAADAARPGRMRVDRKGGRKSKSRFEVRERFAGCTLLGCQPLTLRPHQLRVHLLQARLPVVGDGLYGGRKLWLSRLKRDYRLKPGRLERPLMARAALHAESVNLTHPVTGQPLVATAPWPKDLKVAVKYLRQFAGAP